MAHSLTRQSELNLFSPRQTFPVCLLCQLQQLNHSRFNRRQPHSNLALSQLQYHKNSVSATAGNKRAGRHTNDSYWLNKKIFSHFKNFISLLSLSPSIHRFSSAFAFQGGLGWGGARISRSPKPMHQYQIANGKSWISASLESAVLMKMNLI